MTVMSVAGEFIYRIHALVWRDTSPLRSFYRELGEFIKNVVNEEFSEDVDVMND